MLTKTTDSGKTLFAVAYNIGVRTEKGIVWYPAPGGVAYVTAEHVSQAKAAIINADTKRLVDIIACGPAIGFNVEDEHGEKLRA